MNKKITLTFTFFLLLFGLLSSAQNKYEGEYRIRKVQFPERALGYIQEKLNDAKRIKFYREVDSAKVSYEVKFKKDRLWYCVAFDKQGELEDIEVRINSVDIPDEAFGRIQDYLSNTFKKYRIRKIQQQYPISEGGSPEATIKNAFQNLMIPSVNYEFILVGKKTKSSEQFELLFNAEGNLKPIRKSLSPN